MKGLPGTDILIFDVPTCISFISQHVTLYPGDVIYTGTCEGVGPMDTGDMVEVEISHIGVLRNRLCGKPSKTAYHHASRGDHDL